MNGSPSLRHLKGRLRRVRLQGHFDATFKEFFIAGLLGHIQEHGESRQGLSLESIELSKQNFKHPLGIQIRVGEFFFSV